MMYTSYGIISTLLGLTKPSEVDDFFHSVSTKLTYFQL